MFRSRFLLTAAVAVAAALAAPATSQATFTVTIKEGATTVGSFTDSDNDGIITIAAGPTAFGDFSITGSFSSSTRLTPNVSPATLMISALSVVNNDATNAHTLTIEVSDSPFSTPVGPKNLWSNLSATALNGTYSITNAIDGVNGTTVTASGTGPGSIVYGQGVNGVFNGPYTTGATYTLSMLATINLNAGGQLQTEGGNAQVFPTPAPAGLVMLAGALPFAGLLRLRRRLAKPEATTAS